MSLRRMLPFLLLNVVVSAVVVFAILWWWDGRQPETVAAGSGQIAAMATVTALAQAAGTPVSLAGPAQQPEEEPPAEPGRDGPLVHVVQLGDTLGAISQQYDVPIDAIIAANALENPNILSVGQELTIPAEGDVAAGVAEVPQEDATAPTATTPPPVAEACTGTAVIEIEGVAGVGEFTEEVVQIINSGSCEAELTGWSLGAQSGNLYTFGQVTLFGEGAGIRVHTTAGQDSATDLYWGQEQPIWQSGDIVTLYDAEGALQAEYQVP